MRVCFLRPVGGELLCIKMTFFKFLKIGNIQYEKIKNFTFVNLSSFVFSSDDLSNRRLFLQKAVMFYLSSSLLVNAKGKNRKVKAEEC